MQKSLMILCAFSFFVLVMGLHTDSIAGSEKGPKKCSDLMDNDDDGLIDGDDPDCGEDGGTGGIIGCSTGDKLISNLTTSFVSIFCGLNPTSSEATEANVAFPLPRGGTASNLVVKTHNPPGDPGDDPSPENDFFTFTVMRNGSATSLACTITGIVATTCTDPNTSVVFNTGDTIYLRTEPSNGAFHPSGSPILWAIIY